MSKVKLIGISGGGLNIVNFLESNFSQNYEQKNIEDLNAILENGEKVYIFCTLAGTTGEKNLLKSRLFTWNGKFKKSIFDNCCFFDFKNAVK